MKYLVCLATSARGIQDRSIVLDVAHVEKLGILESVFAALGNVRCHIIQFSESSREFNVALIGETCASKDHDAILSSKSCQLESS